MHSNCFICGLESPPDNHFYHEHKISKEKYFRKYHPKKDLLTSEDLPFKSVSSWLFNDFKNKINLRNYLKQLNNTQKIEYCTNLLKRRKSLKDLVYTPTEIEMRSIMVPSIRYYNSILAEEDTDYYELCDSLGFTNKYVNPNKITLSGVNAKKIIQDTREQKPLDFGKKYETIVEALPYGDYTSKLSNNFIYVDRKSAADFLGTLGKGGFERFKREIERAFLDKKHIIMVVEYNLGKMLGFNKTRFLSRYTKATPEYIFGNLRALCQEYTNFQALFVDDRDEATNIIPSILSNQEAYAKVDLQLLYASGLI